MKLREQLRAYVESHYPVLYLVTFEEEKCDDLIHELAGDRKIMEWNMARGCVRFDTKAPLTEYMDLPAALENWLDQELENQPFLVVRNAHLALRDNPLAVTRLKALVAKIVDDDDPTSATVFLVSSQSLVPPELEMFITVFDLPPPEEEEIAEIISHHADTKHYAIDPDVANQLVLACRGLQEYEITRLLNRAHQRDGTVGAADLALVIAEKRQIVRKSGILEMVSVTESMEDIGGLDMLKWWLERKAKIMADIPRARKFGVEIPKGAMVVGMPGCGKSLTAKATSVLFGLPLLRLDIGSLMGRYVGDSESNMRRALGLAEAVSPCVLWVDEVEKAFTGLGGGGTGSEITSRLFGYFLTWMQEKTTPVFVLATANDVSALPPELLRKGRFDEIFYVDFPNADERAAILSVHLQKRKRDGSKIRLDELAKATDGFSGADLEALVKDAIEEAFFDGEADLDTNLLRTLAKSSRTQANATKKGASKLREKFSKMGVRPASGERPERPSVGDPMSWLVACSDGTLKICDGNSGWNGVEGLSDVDSIDGVGFDADGRHGLISYTATGGELSTRRTTDGGGSWTEEEVPVHPLGRIWFGGQGRCIVTHPFGAAVRGEDDEWAMEADVGVMPTASIDSAGDQCIVVKKNGAIGTTGDGRNWEWEEVKEETHAVFLSLGHLVKSWVARGDGWWLVVYGTGEVMFREDNGQWVTPPMLNELHGAAHQRATELDHLGVPFESWLVSFVEAASFDAKGRYGLIATADGMFRVTTNGGQSWTVTDMAALGLIDSDETWRVDHAVVGVDGTWLIANSEAGLIWFRDSSGEWVAPNDWEISGEITVFGFDAHGCHGLIGTDGGSIRVTSDGGRSWESFPDLKLETFVDCWAVPVQRPPASSARR